MRILWHGVPPWLPTGFASQSAIWMRKLKEAGHDVAMLAVAGISPGEDREWEGIPVLATTPQRLVSPQIDSWRIRDFGPDVIFTHYDHRFCPNPQIYRPYKTVSFITSDGDKLGAGDAAFLQMSAAIPWAISRHEQKLLEEAGYEPPYVPHAIDTSVFAPAADRSAVRAKLGIAPGDFAIGINARNLDPLRKAIPQQIKAFARYRRRNPKARLFIHSLNFEQEASTTPTVISTILANLGLREPDVIIPAEDQALMYLEMFPVARMVEWYQAMDVVLNASMAEGFGLAAVEAQACGTPVILADNSTGPELHGPGWLVPCDDDMWYQTHEAWYGKPLQKPLTEAMAKAAAVTNPASKRAACRQFALQFDVESVWPLFEKALAELSS